MSRQPEGEKRQRQPDRIPHHISSIAHLFFAEDGVDQLEPHASPLTETMDLAVASLNESQISAYACAGLVASTRQLCLGLPGHGARRWRVRLEEDSRLAWSAGSFLTPGDKVPHSSTGRATSQWSWSDAEESAAQNGWLRWSHLSGLKSDDLMNLENLAGAARAAPEGWHELPVARGRHGLVVCLLAKEVGQLATIFQIGRLLGLVAPMRLEIVVFPDQWFPVGKAAQTTAPWQKTLSGIDETLLVRCRRLTEVMAGASPVSITLLPLDIPGVDEAPGETLSRIADRLTADFCVDPSS